MIIDIYKSKSKRQQPLTLALIHLHNLCAHLVHVLQGSGS